jgi:ATP-dependent DNA ligase
LLRGLRPSPLVVNGELPIGDSLSFDALQMRLHPAESRIKKLSHETPAVLILVDQLATPDGERLLGRPLVQRRAALEAFCLSAGSDERLRLSPFARDLGEARRWLETRGGALDGVIAKRLDGPTNQASGRCSKSRGAARRIALLAGSATSAIRAW